MIPHLSSVQLAYSNNEIIKLEVTQLANSGNHPAPDGGSQMSSRDWQLVGVDINQAPISSPDEQSSHAARRFDANRKQCSTSPNDQSQPASVQTHCLLKAPFAATSNLWNDISIEHTLNLLYWSWENTRISPITEIDGLEMSEQNVRLNYSSVNFRMPNTVTAPATMLKTDVTCATASSLLWQRSQGF